MTHIPVINSAQLQQAALLHLKAIEIPEPDHPYLLQLLEWSIKRTWGDEVRSGRFDKDIGRLKEALETLKGRLGPNELVGFLLSVGEDAEQELVEELQKATSPEEAGFLIQERLRQALDES